VPVSRHSAKTYLMSARSGALGKVYFFNFKKIFVECQIAGTRQRTKITDSSCSPLSLTHSLTSSPLLCPRSLRRRPRPNAPPPARRAALCSPRRLRAAPCSPCHPRARSGPHSPPARAPPSPQPACALPRAPPPPCAAAARAHRCRSRSTWQFTGYPPRRAISVNHRRSDHLRTPRHLRHLPQLSIHF
jgi:hypothetical protein